MNDNKSKTVEDCMAENVWKHKLTSLQLNTAQRWRQDSTPASDKLSKLRKSVENNKKGKMKRDNTKKSQGVFPTIENYMLKLRDDLVARNRDHSVEWMHRTVKQLLRDKSKLESLNLAQSEKDQIGNFTGSIGWCEKVMKRTGLIKKGVHSDRKMTAV